MDKSRTCLLCALLTLVYILGGCQLKLVKTNQQTADVVLLNGIIYTLDDNYPQVEAIAIKDGKFLHLGSNAEIESLVGPETKISDLNLFDIPTEAISKTQTLVTYFEGQPVFTRSELN